jgi:hypothetical protein
MCPAIRENVSCDIDYCVSLSSVITFSACISLWKKWSSGDVGNSVHVIPCARDEEGETRIPCTLPESGPERRDSVHVTRKTRFRALPSNFNPRHFGQFWNWLNSVIWNLLLLYDIKIVILFYMYKNYFFFVLRREECNNFGFDWLFFMQFLHFLYSYCIAQFIRLSIFF